MKRFLYYLPKLLITLAIAFGLYAAIYLVRVACLFRAVTGVPCPACGLTRAWLALLRGNVAAAFGMHPLFWSIPILYLYFLTDGKLLGRGRDKWVIGAILAAFGILFICRLAVPAWRV